MTDLPRRRCGRRPSPCPVNPRSDRRRAGPDDRRLRRPAGRRRPRHAGRRARGGRGRWAAAGRRADRARAELPAGPSCPGSWWSATTPGAGRDVVRRPAGRRRHGRCRRCRTPRGSPRCSTPAAPRAARAPRCSATGRCWPTSSRSPRVEPPMIARRRRGARRAAAVPRLRAQRRARRRAAPPAPGWCWSSGFDPEGTLDLIEDEACSVVPGRARRSSRTGWPCRDLRERLGPVRLVLSGLGAAGARAGRDASSARTGIPVHQGYGLTEAAPVVTCTLCSGHARGRLGRRARCPASRSGWSTSRAARPRARTPARSRSAAPTCSAATGPTATDGPDADGLVGHRRRRLPRRRRRPVPRRPAQGAGHRLRASTSTRSEVEDVIREVDGRRRGGGDRRRGRTTTGEAVVAYVVRRRQPTPTTLRRRGARALRRPAGPVQAADRGSRWSTSCR